MKVAPGDIREFGCKVTITYFTLLNKKLFSGHFQPKKDQTFLYFFKYQKTYDFKLFEGKFNTQFCFTLINLVFKTAL